jgi:hypothetical protein
VAHGWREQYDRMKRWRRRVQQSRDDRDAVRDSFYAFAQTCYHLVDWLENDRSQPIRRGIAKRFVKDSGLLSFCRDICNGSKHARLEAKSVNVVDKPIQLGRGDSVGTVGRLRGQLVLRSVVCRAVHRGVEQVPAGSSSNERSRSEARSGARDGSTNS